MPRSISRLRPHRIALALVVLAGTAFPLRAQEAVGYVYRVRGTWTMAGADQPLVVGQGVARADRIQASASGADALLVLWFPGGRVECTDAGELACAAPAGPADCVREEPSRAVDVGRCADALGASRSPGVFAAVARWFQDEPRRFVPLISRDFGFPIEAVVPVNAGRADLTRAFEPAPPNRYRMCMTRVTLAPDDGRPRCEHRVLVQWAPGARVESPDGVSPGLYSLTALPNDGREAWVLAVDGSDAMLVRRALEEAHAATAELGISDLTERRTFERAYMMHLAVQQGIL